MEEFEWILTYHYFLKNHKEMLHYSSQNKK